MKQSTFSAVIANSIKNLLQRYTKGIRFTAILTLLFTLGVGSMLGADYSSTHTSNVTFTAGTNGSAAKVKINNTEYDAMKLGTSSKTGTMSFKIPVGTTTIHLHVAGWNGQNTKLTLSANNSVTLGTTSITSTADAGVKNSSPFTLSSTNKVTTDYYKEIEIKSGATTVETTITISTTTTGYRAVVWGVNAEASSTPDPVKLDKPTNLKVSNVTTTSAILSWNSVTNASGYTVKVGSTSYNPNTTSITLNDLTPSTTYKWSVIAIGDGFSYTDSDEAKGSDFTTDTPIKYTVTWSVDGNTTTEEVYSGDKATEAPTIDENNLPCDGADKFVGWTIGEYKGNSAPGTLYPTAADIPAITGNITFHAVFANYAD